MIVHGIPGPNELERGDVISVDIAVILDGWVADAARTFPVGPISPVAEQAPGGDPSGAVGWQFPTVGSATRWATSRCHSTARRGGGVLDRAQPRRSRHRSQHARGPADPQLRISRNRRPAGGRNGAGRGAMVTAGRHAVRVGEDHWSIFSRTVPWPLTSSSPSPSPPRAPAC